MPKASAIQPDVWIPEDVDDEHRRLLTLAAGRAITAGREFPGHYVALLGDRTLAHGPTLDEVRRRAIEAAGTMVKWVLYVDPQPGPRLVLDAPCAQSQ